MKLKNKGYLLKTDKDIKTIVGEVPLSEYPRPNLVRNSFFCLNGLWKYKITKDGGFAGDIDGDIMVPYAVESPLSMVSHLLEPNEYIFYKREVEVPSELKSNKLILHFEGIDQNADVYVDGELIGGTFLPYSHSSFDITKYINNKKTFILTVRVQDVTDDSYYCRGKQQLEPNYWFYSSSSGIYKSVWMEIVPQNFVFGGTFTGDFDKKTVKVRITTETQTDVEIEINNHLFNIKSNEDSIIDLGNDFHPWSPDDPYLYSVKIKTLNDELTSYFGIKKTETKGDKILLNNKEFFINGLLYQGYFYLGGLTPRSYEEYEFDVKNTKELGYNCLRVHMTTEDDYFYYLCDKYGILVIQDIPCGGEKYRVPVHIYPTLNAKIFNHERFCTLKWHGRNNIDGQVDFVHNAISIIKTLQNFPSIFMYTIFNESWGQFDASNNRKLIGKADPTKLYDTTSGWLKADNTDVYSVHSYSFYWKNRQDKKTHKPFLLTEFGGTSFKITDHFYYPKVYGHGVVQDSKELNEAYKKQYTRIIELMTKGHLKGCIYTQFNDCETECNGIYTLDRAVLKLDEKLVKELNSKINDLNK
ncbi:MAG: hypothetical protein H6689_02125 [Erysipelotrichaceae bacterium]|nr:hypothetical protein [Erysipelotrichaceae bacterium]MCB9500191.1 hypothetical protein [Erysipelotrichaceae bacterium]